MKPEQTLLTRLPMEALFELENQLYEPRFLGVPIGATLTDFFGINFRGGELPLSLTSALRAWLGWWRFSQFGARKRGPPAQLESGRLLLTWLSDTPRLNDLVLPVVAELEPRQFNVIGGAPSIRQKLPAETGFCTQDQILAVDSQAWRSEYAKYRTAWHRAIRRWLLQHGLPLRLFPHLAYALAARSFYVSGFFRFLDHVQPSAVLTDSEHNTPWSCLILAARQRGIPTLQMMHGVIYPPYGYTPLLSDVALCWGQQQREQMVALGTEPERLVVTGCQRLRRTTHTDGNAVRARLELPAEGPVVILATGPMPREEWRKLFYTFGAAFQEHPTITGVVRLHASEKKAFYHVEAARYPRLRLLENQDWTVEEAMAICDVVVIHNSGLGNDALAFGRLVVLLDVLEGPLSNGQTLADKAGCPVVRTGTELRQALDRIIEDAHHRQALHRRAEEYVHWFCGAFGKKAARNVVAELRRRARPQVLCVPAGKWPTQLENTVL